MKRPMPWNRPRTNQPVTDQPRPSGRPRRSKRPAGSHRVRLRIPLRLRLRRTRGRLLRRLITAFLVLIAALCTAAVVAYRLTDIPKPHPETVTQSTVFVDDKGSYLGRRGPVDRQEVPLSQVPRYVQDAVIGPGNARAVDTPGHARAYTFRHTDGKRVAGTRPRWTARMCVTADPRGWRSPEATRRR